MKYPKPFPTVEAAAEHIKNTLFVVCDFSNEFIPGIQGKTNENSKYTESLYFEFSKDGFYFIICPNPKKPKALTAALNGNHLGSKKLPFMQKVSQGARITIPPKLKAEFCKINDIPHPTNEDEEKEIIRLISESVNEDIKSMPIYFATPKK